MTEPEKTAKTAKSARAAKSAKAAKAARTAKAAKAARAARGNGGISLIEMIVAVAIIAALVGLLAPTVAARWTTEAKRCARNTDGMLAKARVYAMSRENEVVLLIEKDASEDKDRNGKYYGYILLVDGDGDVISVEPEGGERLGGSVTLWYGDGGGDGDAWTEIGGPAGPADLAEGEDISVLRTKQGILTLSFHRATGRLETWNGQKRSDTGGFDSLKPTISVNGRYFVTIQPLTGSHEMSGEAP
jgi:type II secretory pathway pseudopilin PulG